MNSHEANSGRTPSTFKCTAIEKQYNQDIKNTLASQLKKKWRMTQKQKRKRKYVHKQAKMESQRNVAYTKIKKHNRHQHNTDDGGQAMGEEIRHVQMNR